MEWGESPTEFYARSIIKVSDGTSLFDYEYNYTTGKSFKSALTACAKGAVNVLDDSTLLDKKGHKVGRRILWVVKDNNTEGAILCRSETRKKRLWTIYAPSVEHVLAYEGSAFPE